MSILRWLHRSIGARKSESDAGPRTQCAIELAVLGIDSRLRLVKAYANRLLPAVESALAHCSALAAAIPGTIDLLPDAWRRDAGVRALFVRSAEIDELLGRSLELLAFAEQPAHAGVDEMCALISLVRTEQKVLGWASHGEILRKDVPQRTVSFSHHRLLAPSVSEAELRRELEWRAYEQMVIEALGCLLRPAAAERPGGRTGALLRERLQLLQRARAGLDALHQPPVADESKFHAVRRQLIDNGRQLASLHQRANSLEERLERVVEVLARSAELIVFGRINDRLTSLNVVAGGEAQAATELCLTRIEVKGAQTHARATAIVRLSRRQLKPRRMDFSAAELEL